MYTFVYMKKPDNNKPVPVRLGELKPIIQKQAFENDRSMHYWILKLLKEGLGVKRTS